MMKREGSISTTASMVCMDLLKSSPRKPLMFGKVDAKDALTISKSFVQDHACGVKICLSTNAFKRCWRWNVWMIGIWSVRHIVIPQIGLNVVMDVWLSILLRIWCHTKSAWKMQMQSLGLLEGSWSSEGNNKHHDGHACRIQDLIPFRFLRPAHT